MPGPLNTSALNYGNLMQGYNQALSGQTGANAAVAQAYGGVAQAGLQALSPMQQALRTQQTGGQQINADYGQLSNQLGQGYGAQQQQAAGAFGALQNQYQGQLNQVGQQYQGELNAQDTRTTGLLNSQAQGYGNLGGSVVGALNNTAGWMGGAQNQVSQGYGQLGSAIQNEIQGVTASQQQAINDAYAQASGQTKQSMFNAGLGNTTIMGAMQRGNLLDQQKANVALANQQAQLSAGYMSQIGQAGLGYQGQAIQNLAQQQNLAAQAQQQIGLQGLGAQQQIGLQGMQNQMNLFGQDEQLQAQGAQFGANLGAQGAQLGAQIGMQGLGAQQQVGQAGLSQAANNLYQNTAQQNAMAQARLGAIQNPMMQGLQGLNQANIAAQQIPLQGLQIGGGLLQGAQQIGGQLANTALSGQYGLAQTRLQGNNQLNALRYGAQTGGGGPNMLGGGFGSSMPPLVNSPSIGAGEGGLGGAYGGAYKNAGPAPSYGGSYNTAGQPTGAQTLQVASDDYGQFDGADFSFGGG